MYNEGFWQGQYLLGNLTRIVDNEEDEYPDNIPDFIDCFVENVSFNVRIKRPGDLLFAFNGFGGVALTIGNGHEFELTSDEKLLIDTSLGYIMLTRDDTIVFRHKLPREVIWAINDYYYPIYRKEVLNSVQEEYIPFRPE